MGAGSRRPLRTGRGGGSPAVGVVREHGRMAASPRAASAPTALRLVLGEEEVLGERAVEAGAAQVRAADPPTAVRRFRAADLTPGDLAESLSPSLFAESRVIVLQAVHEVSKEL